MLLLRALGEIKQQGGLSPTHRVPTLDDREGLPIGEQAPLFSALDQDGKIIKLEDFQGQRRILAFISPGCSACPGTIEVLNRVVQNDHHLAVIVVGSSDSELNRVFAAEHNAQMPILTPDLDLARKTYRIQRVPFLYVLDETGAIRAKGVVNRSGHLQDLLTMADTQVPLHR